MCTANTVLRKEWMCLGMQRNTHITGNNLIPVSVLIYSPPTQVSNQLFPVMWVCICSPRHIHCSCTSSTVNGKVLIVTLTIYYTSKGISYALSTFTVLCDQWICLEMQKHSPLIHNPVLKLHNTTYICSSLYTPQ